MGKQYGFSAIESLLILVIVGITSFTGWYVLNAKNKANSIYSSARTVADSTGSGPFRSSSSSVSNAKTQSTSNKSPSSNTSPDSQSPASSTKTVISMNLSPSQGPVGTKVNVQISGIQDTANLKLALTDSRSDYDDKGISIQPRDVHNGNYSGTYTIPSSVVNIYSGCPRICYADTAKGPGKLILTYGQNSIEYVNAAFIVE